MSKENQSTQKKPSSLWEAPKSSIEYVEEFLTAMPACNSLQAESYSEEQG